MGKGPTPSSDAARRRMEATGRKDTAAEMRVRRILHRKGLRYRVDFPVLNKPRRRADIVFTKAKVAVFVDGCFWHGCPKHGTWPKANFWREKIETNQTRDRDTDERLKKVGWSVIRVWEHEDPDMVAKRIEKIVRSSTIEVRK